MAGTPYIQSNNEDPCAVVVLATKVVFLKICKVNQISNDYLEALLGKSHTYFLKTLVTSEGAGGCHSALGYHAGDL